MPLPALAIPALLKLGEGLIDRFFPDPDKASAAKLELLKMQESGDLARMVNDTKLTELVLADTQSARDREVKIATSTEAPYLNKIIVPCLAIGVLVCSFVLFGVLLLDDGTIDSSRKDVFIYILGVLSAIDTQIIAYFFGSSAGSTAKDQTLKRVLNAEK